MSKHTPGPWETSVNEAGEWDVCEGGGGDMIADLKGCINAEGNAPLMAAAPDLLAALKECMAELERAFPYRDAVPVKDWDCRYRAAAIIARAEGSN